MAKETMITREQLVWLCWTSAYKKQLSVLLETVIAGHSFLPARMHLTIKGITKKGTLMGSESLKYKDELEY